MSRLTASGVDRARACVASMALPQSGSRSAASSLGTVVHEFLLNVSLVGREMALERTPEEYRDACGAIDLDRLREVDPKSYAGEVAFALNLEADTARELGRGLARDYSGARPGELCGTADVVGLSEDAVHVQDYKTGWGWLPPPADNWQLRTLALMAARTFGRTRAVVGLIRLRDGRPWYDTAELDELDLEATAAELRGLMERAAEEEARLAKGEAPRTVESSHCKYCPAFVHCPAKMNLVRETAFAAVGEQPAPVITEETAPALVARLEAIDAVVERVRRALEEYATANPVQLPNGEVYGPCEVERETIDPMKGSAILAEKYGSKVGMDAVKQEPAMPKTRLSAALKAWMLQNPGFKLANLEREAMELLRAGGAVKVTVSTTVKRHKPTPQLKAGEG